jgi:bifunctional UDP-N-acetylglucosamine pyrophosphorylase/glucosamine-1-phosphate N-acetyltransferase
MTDIQARELKAVLLAGGKNPDQAGEPILLQPLGDRLVIDHMLHTALQFVPAQDLYIVVGFQQAEVMAHLGEQYQYVVQEQPLGTGHAVLQLLPMLKDYPGDLLILYGDTPLFQSGSIRGLLNRHRLRQADLTLLTAVVDQPLPYGHILRASSGQIIDIVEEKFASAEMRKIRELNMGGYAANASPLFATLKQLARSEGEIRLTDCAYQMIRLGHKIESYQIVARKRCWG